MSRYACLAIGIAGYLIGMSGLVLFILFAGGWPIGSLSIDNSPRSPVGIALVVNTCLVAAFGLQHTVMARPWFKRRWSRIVPSWIERSVYCVATAAAVGCLCGFWQPLPGVVWTTNDSSLRALLIGLQLCGWATAVGSSFMISHTELFGLQQVAAYAAGRHDKKPVFTERGLYRFVRHPLQFGVLVGMWATPHMSTSHMFLSAMLSAYILVGLHHEERDLVTAFGEDYLAYQQRVPMLLPFITGAPAPSRPTIDASPTDSAV